MTRAVDEVVSVSDLLLAVRRQQAKHRPAEVQAVPDVTTEVVSVSGAHPGVGATTVALALAEAISDGEREVTLVDEALNADAFAAAECEVDSGDSDWKAGRRGSVRILRGSSSSEPPGGDRVIVDGSRPDETHHVLVCRATLPSLRRAEPSMTSGTAVAVVAAARWPRRLRASLGPAMSEAISDGRVVFFPYSRDLDQYGVDADPLPAPTLAVARRLAELLMPGYVGTTSPNRRKGLRR
ncbi:MAG: hypothetical protein ABIR39_18885 [Nocardioides sp.]|uniref:hypothetical protein n=1 Tax=Nocardioides sp. TaxID=35761 RepID=UPI00326473D1